jgi:ribosome assembly protein YihI (activator of Der GTPase)
MSRNKKSRAPGLAGQSDVIIVRERSESDVEGRLRKKLKKHKGLKSGNRHSSGSTQQEKAAAAVRDPRLGSKKKIPLIVNEVKKASKAERRVLAEKELESLENDAQLNVLLDRIDDGERLGAGLQKYVDEKLDRIEALMKQLGIYDDIDDSDDEDETESESQVIMSAPKAKKKLALSDDELLSQFENMNLDNLKE